jgi:WD40 repeat protein
VDQLHTLNLWHVETGRQLAAFAPAVPTNIGNYLTQAAFSPDGQHLVSWRKNASCQLWRAPTWADIDAEDAKPKAGGRRP